MKINKKVTKKFLTLLTIGSLSILPTSLISCSCNSSSQNNENNSSQEPSRPSTPNPNPGGGGTITPNPPAPVPIPPTPAPTPTPEPVPQHPIDPYYYGDFVKLQDGSTFINSSLTTLANNTDESLLTPKEKEQKKLVLKYGTFPIDINKNDEDITIEDLIKMFDVIAYLRLGTLTFGNRNIDAKKVAIAYARWYIESWKYFPYATYNNPARRFRIKTMDEQNIPNNQESMFNKIWYLDSTHGGNYANGWIEPGQEQKDFIDFVGRFLSGVDPRMSDIDKMFYAFMFVGSWINYGGMTTPLEATISKHRGVCINYASLLSFCYNLIGLPSIPMAVAMGDKSNNPSSAFQEPHALAWVYIDAEGNGKQWYSSDATFGDTANQMNLTFSVWNQGLNTVNGAPFYNALFCNTQDGPFKTETGRYAQYNNNVFFDMPFSMVYDKKYRSEIGQAAIGKYNFLNRQTMFKSFEQFSQFSRWFFFKDHWYFVAKKQNSQTFGFYKGTFNDKNIIDITNEIPHDQQNKILSKPMLYKFGDYLIFNENDERFRLHNMNDVSWNNDIFVPIDQSVKSQIGTQNTIGDFYVDADGYICIYGSNNVDSDNGINWQITPIRISQNLYSLIKSNFSQRDRDVAKTYFDWVVGTKKIKTDNFDFGITLEARKKFYKDIKSIYDDPSILPNTAIEKMYQKFNEVSKSCYDAFTNFDLVAKTSTEIYLPQNVYDDNGYQFNINAWSNPGLSTQSKIFRFDIYYSQQKTTDKNIFSKIASNLFEPKITKELISNPEGYYFIRVYIPLNPQKYIDTDIIHFIVDPNSWDKYLDFYNSSIKLTNNKLETNYEITNPNWFKQKLLISTDVDVNSMNLFKYNVKETIYFINKSTQAKTMLDQRVLQIGASRFNYEKRIDIDNTTHGIYYIKYEIIETSSQNVLNVQYSKNSFVFTKEDVDYFNLDEWKQLAKKVE